MTPAATPNPPRRPGRKAERSKPGIAMPEVQGTIEALVDIISHGLLAGLEAGASSHLVIADKQPVTHRLPLLPGVVAGKPFGAVPVTRSARKVGDSWHKDQFYGFVYVVRGEADMLLCRKVITCRAGDFIFLLPQTWRPYGSAPHWERADSAAADSELLWLFFNQDGCTIHFCMSRGAEHARSPVLFIHDSSFLPLLEFFGREALVPKINGAISVFVWAIFERVLRRLKEERAVPSTRVVQPAPGAPGGAGSGARAKAYIETNLSEKLTLAIVARAIHVSRTKLAQDFHAQIGETFGRYLLRRRLEEAQNLLRTTELTVSQVSWVAGFSNPNYFSTAFRRHVGSTPTQYREDLHEK